MIFNPLYFSETGNSQMLVAKPGKLSNNKYLFSDIVKVVMNSDLEQKKLLETDLEGIVKNQLPIVAGIENASTQIKFTELSENDSEKVKLDLADILPPEIAELLVSDQIVLNKDHIISYISKEPLEGDLEKFINQLVGEETLNENLTKETGLFLHLEDLKSAVNIELLKETDTKQSAEKVIVQTLVVPEKSKLISLFKASENLENADTTNKNLSSIKIPLDYNSINLNEEEQSNFKPTLSVYTFKNTEQNIQPLIGNQKDNIKLELINTNLVASNKNNFSVNVPLEKISFIPSEIKTKNLESEKSNILNEIKPNSEIIKNAESSKNISDKEFSVTKITIVKKQDGLFEELNLKEKIKDNRIDPDLRKINFSEIYKSEKSEFRLLKNILNNSEANIKANNSKNILINPINQNVSEQIKTDLKNGNKNISGDKIITTDKPNSILKLEKVANENNLQKVSFKSENINSELKTSENKSEISKNANKINSETNLVKEAKPEVKLDLSQKVKENIFVKTNERIISKENISDTNQLKNNIDSVKIAENQSKDFTEIDVKKSNINENIEFSKTSKIVNILKIETEQKSEIHKAELKEINLNSKSLPQENKNQNAEIKFSETPKSDFTKQESIFNKELKTSDESIKSDIKVNNEKEISNSKTDKNFEVNEKNVKVENTQKDITEKNINKNVQTFESERKEKHEEVKIGNTEKIITNEEIKKTKIEKNDFNKVNNSDIKENLKTLTKNENTTDENLKVNIQNKNVEILQNEESRKLSVKVKSNVKAISNKLEDNNLQKSVKVEKEQTDLNKEDAKQNLFDSNKQNSLSAEKVTAKLHHEINFDSLVKDELKKDFEITNKSNIENEISKAHKVVKSTEIIKELSKFISTQEKGSLTFDIKPESLGKMKITLSTVENVLKASIEVDNEQAKHLVERNVEKLQEELSKNGIQLNSLNISLGQPKNHKGEKRSNTKNNSNENQFENEIVDFSEDRKTKTLGYNTYEYIA
ncbi:MAG: flagellar hook-length control protein FliK [Ignavibacteriae bacterium]|nr:flagellar hook-length control protein FliK [Ignavibacteriota bacterium]